MAVKMSNAAGAWAVGKVRVVQGVAFASLVAYLAGNG